MSSSALDVDLEVRFGAVAASVKARTDLSIEEWWDRVPAEAWADKNAVIAFLQAQAGCIERARAAGYRPRPDAAAPLIVGDVDVETRITITH